MNRRRFLARAGGLLVAAPIIVRASSIMPVRALPDEVHIWETAWPMDFYHLEVTRAGRLSKVFLPRTTVVELGGPSRTVEAISRLVLGPRSVFDAAFLSPRSEVAPALREAVKMEVLDGLPKC